MEQVNHQAVGELLASIVDLCIKTCVKHDIKLDDCIFTLGACTTALLKFNEGPENELSTEAKVFGVSVLMAGMEQELIMICGDGGEIITFDGAIPADKAKGH